MLAAIVERPGSLVIKDIKRPVPKEGEFLVRVEAASICNATDNHILQGIFDGHHNRYPQVLGHEVCGTVEEIGPGAEPSLMGRRVALYTPNGAFQEYVVVSSRANIAFVPGSLTPEEGSICEMFDGSYCSLVAPAQLTWDDTVLAIGAGPMGLTAVGMAALQAGKVIAVDFHKNRLDMAKEFGAAFTYDRSKMNVNEILDAIQKDAGVVDVSFMCIALDRSRELDAFHLAVEATRQDGRISGLNVEVQLEHHNHQMNPFHMNRKNIKYRHYLERVNRREDFQEAYNTVGQGKFPIGKMITHRVTLDRLEWALDMTYNHPDQCLKIIVYPGGE
jgi:threonine dehydrogenase-like Zn-dependent dehydrogenase